MPKLSYTYQGHPFQLFLSPRLREAVELLSQDRLVRREELGSTDRAVYRLIERLRGRLLDMKIPIGIRSIQGEGYVLVIPECKPNGGQLQPMGALERHQQTMEHP